MDEKPKQRLAQFGYLFWSSLILTVFFLGFVAGWKLPLGWLRAEFDELLAKTSALDAEIKMKSRVRDSLEKRLERQKARLEPDASGNT